VEELRAEIDLPCAPDVARAWHGRSGAFERLVPPWVDVRVEERSGTIEPGDRVLLRVRQGPATFRWELEHAAPEGGAGFADVQRRGPFASWRHDHVFRPDGEGCVLEDRVRFALPAPLGWAGGLVRRDLGRLLAYRQRVTRGDLAALARAGALGGAGRTVMVSGAGGLLGRALVPVLALAGHRVLRLVRRPPRGPDERRGDPARGVEPDALADVDAIVHLAGESIAGGLWTRERMRRIRESRAAGTLALVESVRRADPRPATLLSASAIGAYGSRGDEALDEDSARGHGFLADVCRAWEAPLEAAGAGEMRTASLRFGLILSARGGLLARMGAAFRAGLGGPLGDGSQWMSWVSVDDAALACLHVLRNATLSGPVNIAAPGPVRNAEFTRTLARVLRRPALVRAPAVLLRAISRPMADEAFLASQRVVPRRLIDSGFVFRDPELETALRHELGRWPRGSPAGAALTPGPPRP